MKNDFYEKMVSDPNGQISSTRVMAWNTWKFTKVWMVVFLVIIAALLVIDGIGKIDVDVEALDRLVSVYVWTVIILLVATYAPKSIVKFAETMGDKILKK